MTEPLSVPRVHVPACQVVLLELAQRFEARASSDGGESAGRQRQPWLDAAAMAREMAAEVLRGARR